MPTRERRRPRHASEDRAFLAPASPDWERDWRHQRTAAERTGFALRSARRRVPERPGRCQSRRRIPPRPPARQRNNPGIAAEIPDQFWPRAAREIADKPLLALHFFRRIAMGFAVFLPDGFCGAPRFKRADPGAQLLQHAPKRCGRQCVGGKGFFAQVHLVVFHGFLEEGLQDHVGQQVPAQVVTPLQESGEVARRNAFLSPAVPRIMRNSNRARSSKGFKNCSQNWRCAIQISPVR